MLQCGWTLKTLSLVKDTRYKGHILLLDMSRTGISMTWKVLFQWSLFSQCVTSDLPLSVALARCSRWADSGFFSLTIFPPVKLTASVNITLNCYLSFIADYFFVFDNALSHKLLHSLIQLNLASFVEVVFDVRRVILSCFFPWFSSQWSRI